MATSNPEQEEGFLGRLVGGMIRRSIRARFHTVYWSPPKSLPVSPSIFVPNHHGWFDGYIMFLCLSELKLRFVDWIAEYAAFPLFGKVGGMPFPPGEVAIRSSTIRKTIRLMREEKRNLLLFAEGVLHRPPILLPFGNSLSLVAKKSGEPPVWPVAIHYSSSIHERPECFILFGEAIEGHDNLTERVRAEVETLLTRLREKVSIDDLSDMQVLMHGTGDVNERWDLKKLPRVFPSKQVDS